VVKQKKVIIDCDPGKDDAIALFLSLQSASLDVTAVTTVAGNTSLENTTLNALRLLSFAGRWDIPVIAGMSHPVMEPTPFIGTFHGPDGLGGISLPESPAKSLAVHAVDYIIGTIRQSAEKVTLIAVGPLSNIAMALSKEPDILSNIENIVVMGGAITVPGNVSPTAEFNMSVDPLAAKYVFASSAPITLVPLDATLKAKTNRAQINAIRALKTNAGILVADILDSYLETYHEEFGYDAAPIHDALAVAVAIDPSLVTMKDMYVDVSIEDSLTRAQTVGDVLGKWGKPTNVSVCLDVDNERFQSLLYASLARYS